MNKLVPYLIAWILSIIFVFYYAYNRGVEITEAKMQQVVTMQIESNIKDNNNNIALVENLNEYNLKNWQKLLYPKPITIIKYIKKSQICESGKISQQTIDVINGGIK
jgi:hypothetical protein